jgi:hypothetical protein
VYSPPVMVIYGGPGIGKTSFGIGADASTKYSVGKENHLLINIDYRGADRLVCNRATDLLNKPIQSVADIDLIFKYIAENDHDIEWLVFDDLSTMEEMFVTEVCTDNKVSAINQIEYGRGYELARAKWYHLFLLIKDLQEVKPIGIILIGHTKVENVKDPVSESYSRHDLQLDKRSKEIIKKSVDLIGFAHKKVLTKKSDAAFGKKENVPVGKSERVLTIAPDLEGFESKDRFNLPEEIQLDWSIFIAELNKSLNANKETNSVEKKSKIK